MSSLMTSSQRAQWRDRQLPHVPEPPVLEALAVAAVMIVVCFVGEMWVW